MKIHQLKIKQTYAERLMDGTKTCELRFNDRDFQKGDIIMFDVIHDNQSPQFFLPQYEITHVLMNYDGIATGFCILSIRLLTKKTTHDKET